MKHIGIALAGLALLAGCNQEPAAPADKTVETTAAACDFDCTLDRHIRAIQQHDFAAFAPTITDRQEVDLIFPDGALVQGRDAYMKTLKDFLDGGGFDFQYRLVRKQVGADMGYALLDVTQLNEGQPDPSRYYLLLVFALQDGSWRLVHDQNTRLPPVDASGDEGA